jgi:hypothetical protein
MNGELERTWKEAIVALIEVLDWHWLEGLQETLVTTASVPAEIRTELIPNLNL